MTCLAAPNRAALGILTEIVSFSVPAASGVTGGCNWRATGGPPDGLIC